MTRIFVPSTRPDDWRTMLAHPKKHWVRRKSARTLAYCWEDAGGFPPEVRAVLRQHPILAKAEPLLIFPEWKVTLPGGNRSSQNDAWILAKSDDSLISIAVEGKVDESFDKKMSGWLKGASDKKKERLAFLANTLGLSLPIPDNIRYQLLHRTASAVLEAQRFGATHAVMLVHSFSPTDKWHDDFKAFVSLFGQEAVIGQIVSVMVSNGIPLHFAWVHGEERFLNA